MPAAPAWGSRTRRRRTHRASACGTSAKNWVSTCSTTAIARGASCFPCLVTRSRRARVSAVSTSRSTSSTSIQDFLLARYARAEENRHSRLTTARRRVGPQVVEQLWVLVNKTDSRIGALPRLLGLDRINLLVPGTCTRPVDVNGDARRVRRRFDELEVQRSGQILEQGKPGAECGGLDHESVLVDQSESGQSLVEGGATVGDQVVPRVALETADLFLEVAAGDSRLRAVGVL